MSLGFKKLVSSFLAINMIPSVTRGGVLSPAAFDSSFSNSSKRLIKVDVPPFSTFILFSITTCGFDVTQELSGTSSPSCCVFVLGQGTWEPGEFGGMICSGKFSPVFEMICEYVMRRMNDD